MKRYNPSDIELKWQKKWAEAKTYKAEDFSEKPKFVMLTEFPYPSGIGIHMGHVREYTLGDIIARHKRALGHNVLYPMGFDCFGLPTENFAIKNKISPQVATEENTANFRKQLDMMGYSIDWGRSFNTSDPDYYRWTQWMFLQFYKAGLAYQDEIAINWCPFCKTGLANEEVVNGRHERCDNPVEKKKLKQWMLRITDYADKLIDGLATVDYPSRIADQQINWIGRSEGAEIKFAVDGGDEVVKVFTTRPDTIFGATFMVLAPEHPSVVRITTNEQREKVNSYVEQTAHKSDIERQENKEKTGVFTGAYAVNPATNKKIPIWIADYILGSYGEGAIMAVPAHDERDGEFAKKFDLPIIRVISSDDNQEEIFAGNGLMINSGKFNGKDSVEAGKEIIEWLSKKGIAKSKVNYKLRDWVYSRQHYWGEPIPIIHCPKCGIVPVPEDQLPVELPVVDHYEPTDDGKSPLSQIDSWVNVTCPKCGELAKRETDTMPNWAGSNWYYLRYYDAHNNKEFASQKKLKYWDMVDLYLGGMEHTTLHLLYSRFHHKFLHNQGLVPTKEPYASRRGQGIILAADGRKMSKSLGNVVDPTEIIKSGYGADAVRLTVTFLAPYDQTTAWSPETVAGCYRFLGRVWNLAQEVIEKNGESNPESLRVIHGTIKKVSIDLEKMNFNTAIAALMEAVNELNKIGLDKVSKTDLSKLIQVLAPFAPHISAELYEKLGNPKMIDEVKWPEYDEKCLITNEVSLAVQVNGKLRGEVKISKDATEEEVKKIALELENVQNFVDKKEIKKVIYIPDKIINFVV